jgi:Arc/MetJ family transcription regulator
MSRTNIDLDDEAVADVMRTYHLATKREAVNFALNKVRRHPMSTEEVLALEGIGWDGDLDAIKNGNQPAWWE